MKKLTFKCTVLLLFGASLILFSSCQEEEIIPEEVLDEQVPVRLKSAQNSNYIFELITMTESTAAEAGTNENPLIFKLNNAIRQLNKNNKENCIKQLKLFISQVTKYADRGIFTSAQKEELIKYANNAILLVEGSFIDIRDGNEYKVVLIGDQIWMAENLAWLPRVTAFNYIDRPPGIFNFVEGASYYVYDYNGGNATEAKAKDTYRIYGVLYDRIAAMNAAPDGWHLPNNREWDELVNYICDVKGVTMDEIAEYLKSTSGWNVSNGTDDFGFSALPGGMFFRRGSFGGEGSVAIWWSGSQEFQPPGDYCYTLWNINENQFRYSTDCFYAAGEYGYSVRCVKN